MRTTRPGKIRPELWLGCVLLVIAATSALPGLGRVVTTSVANLRAS
jgi:hypothetical protein